MTKPKPNGDEYDTSLKSDLPEPDVGATGKSKLKGICLAGIKAATAIAILVGVVYPTAETLQYLASCFAILAAAALLAMLATKSRLLTMQLRPEVVLLVVSLFISVSLAELGLRFFCYQSFPNIRHGYSLHYRYDSQLGWFPVPNGRTESVGAHKVTLANNSKGFRGPEHAMDDRPRIVFLGDSFVWGYDVEAADRFTEKFQDCHPEWSIYNFGISGYGTDQEYLLLQRHFKEYQPRLVFLVFCTENDDEGNSCNNVGAYYKPYCTVEGKDLTVHGIPVPRSERVFCAEHPIVSRLYMARLAVRAFKNLTNPPAKRNETPTFAIIRQLQNFVSSNGAQLVVGLTDRHSEVEHFLQRSGIPQVDLSTSLRFASDDHWTPDGHTFVANKINEFLMTGGYMSQEGSDRNKSD